MKANSSFLVHSFRFIFQTISLQIVIPVIQSFSIIFICLARHMDFKHRAEMAYSQNSGKRSLRNDTQWPRNFFGRCSRLLARLSLISINPLQRSSENKWRNLDTRVFVAARRTRAGHREEDGKLRKFFCPPFSLSFSISFTTSYANFILKSRLKDPRFSKGLAAFALIGAASLIGERTQCERVKTGCLRETPSRAVHVKRRIIRSLMPDYHALSWRTCGRKRANERARARALAGEAKWNYYQSVFQFCSLL